MKKTILEKLYIINRTAWRLITDEDNTSIIKTFTEEAIEILGADFGFVWGKLNEETKHELIYKSSSSPLNPTIPIPLEREKHYQRNKGGDLLFDPNVKKEYYESGTNRNLKSYIIIPIRYGDHVYGNIVLGYKKPHNFTEEELILSDIIENNISHLVIINWIIENGRKAQHMAGKQKETEVFLAEEKLKTEFIANATHELRTPLAVIKGNVDLALLNKENLKEAMDTIHKVNLEVSHLSNIISDLEIITSEDKKYRQLIDRKPVNIADLLEDITKRLQAVSHSKNISIKIRTTANKLLVPGNIAYLEKLFLNLIKNAISYGKDNGNIFIDLEKEKNIIKISITDDGLGISKEDLPRIFDRFYRGDKAHTNAKESHSGLGLSIAKWAAEIHGGTISVKSTEGKGSTFSVLLPVADDLS